MGRKPTPTRAPLVLCMLTLVLVPYALFADDKGKRETEEGWEKLFEGKSLAGWEITEFGGQGKVRIENDTIVLDMGVGDLTGITWTGEVRRMNYEIALDAMRVAGHDFFCGLTFPYKDSCCSLIVGGWGGSLVGISSFDDLDASENETTTTMDFENERWYSIRVRVTENRIQAWVDAKKVVDARPDGRKVSVRGEVELSQPLGIAAWNTKAALSNIRVRSIQPPKADDE